MDAFVFHNPTRFVFGPDAEARTGEEVSKLGIGKVLLVYGQGSVVRSGVLARVKASLDAAGVRHCELGGVLPNPLSGLVYQGIEQAKAEQVEAVMGVGGGSAIDTAKAIALGVRYPGDFWDLYAGKAQAADGLPIITVLTLSAAGSESSNSSVITNEQSMLKRGTRTEFNRPRLSLMNPALTYSLPNNQKANGVADMMAHIFERYFTNTKDVTLSDELCEGTLRTIITAGPKALAEGESYAAHADLMWAGTLAHNDTLSPGRQQDWSCHGMSHAVSARFGAAHGAVLAVLYPHWMQHQLDHDVARFERFAVQVMGVDDTSGDAKSKAEAGIRALRTFFNSLGLPQTLSEFNVQEKDLEKLTDEAPYSAQGTLGFFRPLDRADVLAIYRAAL
ncbi:MAG: iron-containing alcohol dehydrogenase [Clostridiales bacterium]|nr:iron-containing alcohol dehydrogenase [Clostridiales bacterium]